jgi:hypothetical protein
MPDQQQVEFLTEFPASTTDALPGNEIKATVGLGCVDIHASQMMAAARATKEAKRSASLS